MILRFYSSSCVLYSMKKQGMKLHKMLNPKNKRQWYPSQTSDLNILPTLNTLTKTQRVPDNQGIRRVAVLNKLFMKHITDIMSTGTVSMDIIGRGIEISKVNVAKDFKTINIFWICKGDASDKDTDKLLQTIAGPLRHELSTLRLMGEVPYIYFVKDKQESQIVDVDKRLLQADYGEDYTPTDMGELLKSEFTLNLKLSPELKAKIKQLEDRHEIFEDPIPEMTNSVYGLDHTKIMNRLLAARKRSKDAWENLESESPVISYRTTNTSPSNIDHKEQKKEIAEFLIKRQILHNKLQRARRKQDDTHVEDEQIEETNEDIYEFCDDYDDNYAVDYISEKK
ncbi:putative ribosome-binding factor A, mitochondrial isoform X1 [Pieris brassicae]|uniref:putative ribosome-binding factor A, mitochondrial isoform X1 n=2 Tax=Pieris brassicae TaxID=7116 RepID=UPI001E6610A2|nr:putative ribosome-binding factor A, mitochondrial isoform X1 [Pieris brassicae]